MTSTTCCNRGLLYRYSIYTPILLKLCVVGIVYLGCNNVKNIKLQQQSRISHIIPQYYTLIQFLSDFLPHHILDCLTYIRNFSLQSLSQIKTPIYRMLYVESENISERHAHVFSTHFPFFLRPAEIV